jgi:histidinol-phosphate aminotransferase
MPETDLVAWYRCGGPQDGETEMATTTQDSLTRRNFLTGAAAGVGSLALADRMAIAQSLLSGGALTAADIQGWGVPPGVVGIGSNENPWGPSPMAVRAIADDMHNLNRYDWSAVRELTAAISDSHGFPRPPKPETRFGPSGYPVHTEAGSSFILRLIALNIGVQNDAGEIIEADPAYGSVSRTGVAYGRAFGTEVSAIRVPLTKDYKHDLGAMLDAISDRTTLVVITNPNNPTGTIIPQEDIEAFVASVPEHVTVFVDEAYMQFNRIPGNAGSAQLAANNRNVIVSRTFSKAFGLAGLRVGYAIAHPDVVARLAMFGNSGGIGRINARAAIAALGDHSFVRMVLRRTNEGKDFFYEAMNRLGLEYIESHSSFVLVNAGQDGKALAERMMKRNVQLSRLGVGTNPDYANYVRFTMGTIEELEVAVNVLEEELSA